jgi:hypothetical protein
MPTGYESGKTWSPIGAQATVSTSAASRVWTINEVAAYEGADTWPAPVPDFALFSTTTVSSDVQSITLSSIPQTHRDLKIVIRAATTDTVSDITWIQPNADTNVDNYRLFHLSNSRSGSGAGSQSYSFFSYDSNKHPGSTWPQGSSGRGSLNERTALETYIPNYTNAGSATSGSLMHTGSGSNNNIASPPNNDFLGISASTLNLSAAITSIRIIEPQANAIYYYATGTQISLYGIGKL